jgi:pyruvate,water dikinase
LKRLFPDNVPTGLVICFRERNIATPAAKGRLREGVACEIGPLLTPEKMYAVRSSAVVEDGPSASFAGQFFTALAVRGVEAVLDSIFTCLESQHEPGVAAYASRMSTVSSGGFACLVQELIPAVKSGVAFTNHPTSTPNAIVINASFGLGNLLVNGEITPDTITFDRSARSYTYEIGSKCRMSIATRSGLQVIEVPAVRRLCQALDGQEIAEICDYALSAEAEFGYPLDIEWAIARGKVFLLQCRPITKVSG